MQFLPALDLYQSGRAGAAQCVRMNEPFSWSLAMRRFLFTTATLAGLIAATAVIGTAAKAQPYGGGYGPGYGMGPGMMGGYGPGYGHMGGGYGPGYGMGPGVMGGYGPGYGPGMMGPGYGPGMMGPGYGPGMMGGSGPGPGYGPGYGRDLNLTTDNVKTYLEQMIRNPNLKVGEVKEQGNDEITATIVTKEKDALVQKLVVNRHTGFFRPEVQ
jgi:hypothetical protein